MTIPEKLVKTNNDDQVNRQNVNNNDNVELFGFDDSILNNLSVKKPSLSFSYSNSEISDNKINRKKRLKQKLNEDEMIRFIDSSNASQNSSDKDKFKLLTMNSKPMSIKKSFQTNYLKRTESFSSPSLYDNSNDIFLFKFNADFSSLKSCLESILKEMRYITNKLEENEEYEDRKLKCKFAAVVLDRLCMVIFSILILLSTAIIFTSDNFMKNSDPDEKF
jgi:hypothetical protein